MPINLDLSITTVEYLNRCTLHRDWCYAFYDAPQRHWSAIFRKAWNANRTGIRLQQHKTNCDINERALIWFELANGWENKAGELHYYLCLDAEKTLVNHNPAFLLIINRILLDLQGKIHPFTSIEQELLNATQTRLRTGD